MSECTGLPPEKIGQRVAYGDWGITGWVGAISTVTDATQMEVKRWGVAAKPKLYALLHTQMVYCDASRPLRTSILDASSAACGHTSMLVGGSNFDCLCLCLGARHAYMLSACSPSALQHCSPDFMLMKVRTPGEKGKRRI